MAHSVGWSFTCQFISNLNFQKVELEINKIALEEKCHLHSNSKD